MASGLLAQLDLTGKVVTGDALYAQRDLSQRVLEQDGDYFWVLKDNQPGVKEAVSLLFEQPPWGESFGAASQEGRRGRPVGKAAVVDLDSFEPLPGLARLGAGLLCGTDQEAQGTGRRWSGPTPSPACHRSVGTLCGCWRYGGGTGGSKTGCTG